MMTLPFSRPPGARALGVIVTLAAAAAPGLTMAQSACSHESRCPEGQSWDEASGSCTVPLSS